jgi:hypothetical protein
MNAIFKKLNFNSQSEIIVLNSPESFKVELDDISISTKVIERLTGVKLISFILIFVTKKIEIDSILPKIKELFEDDVILWFAYPKGTSKRYECDFNRDTGWDVLWECGFEGVRMVAIDENWSALRFRKVEYIKKMSRRKSMAMSKDGKKKTKGN